MIIRIKPTLFSKENIDIRLEDSVPINVECHKNLTILTRGLTII